MNPRMLILTVLTTASAAAAQPLDLTWHTVDSGGGTSSGGTYTLRGTIGQHDAGALTGGAFILTGGFWAGGGAQPCYPDCDITTGVGVLDIFDFLCFQNRYVGNDPYACDCDTSTGPGVCDIFDFLCFQNAFANGCP